MLKTLFVMAAVIGLSRPAFAAPQLHYWPGNNVGTNAALDVFGSAPCWLDNVGFVSGAWGFTGGTSYLFDGRARILCSADPGLGLFGTADL
jgi:hypothetical protein